MDQLPKDFLDKSTERIAMKAVFDPPREIGTMIDRNDRTTASFRARGRLASSK